MHKDSLLDQTMNDINMSETSPRGLCCSVQKEYC